MESTTTATATENNNTMATAMTVKGKRTKRQRPPATVTATSAAGAAASSSSTSSSNISGTTATDEEEDMAHCLILLARGGRDNPDSYSPRVEIQDHHQKQQQINSGVVGSISPEKVVVSTGRRFAETATTTDGRTGFLVYECKTCNKCFPSFQALGGHRASHKKPKLSAQQPPLTPVIEKKDSYFDDEESLRISLNSFSSRQLISSSSTGKPKVHECSLCGAEFSSGQALGGHMRRHRPLNMQDSSSSSPSPQSAGTATVAAVAESSTSKKEKNVNVLSLDLNLPAPPEDDRNDFSRSPAIAAFPVSALFVDCHY